MNSSILLWPSSYSSCNQGHGVQEFTNFHNVVATGNTQLIWGLAQSRAEYKEKFD